jgi:hypothetical protein
LTGPEAEPRLPPGYRLDTSDPDLWMLRRPEGWVVAYFSVRGATREAIEAAAWEAHESYGKRSAREEDPRLHPPLQRLLVRRGRCRIRIYREDGRAAVVVCSQLPDDDSTSVTNMAEYLAVELAGERG